MTLTARLVSRSAWGARPPRSTPRVAPLKTGQAIHWTWKPKAHPLLDAHWPKCYDAVRGVQNYHMDTQGWNDTAYNFITCPHGFVFEGRGWDVRNGATGTADANENYLAVCFIMGEGDSYRDEYTWAAQDLIQAAIDLGASDLQRPHSAFKSTTCPGLDLASLADSGGLYTPPSEVEPLPDPKGPHTPIMGPPSATFDQARTLLNGRGVYRDEDVDTIIRTYWRLCIEEGVDFAVAMGQAFKETGYFQYGGDVDPSQWNFAGIGATGGVPGVSFISIEAGVHAHVRRLRMYAEGSLAPYDLNILVRPLDESHWGRYPDTWLAGQVWAAGTNYNESWMTDYILPLRNVEVPEPAPAPETTVEDFWVEGGIHYTLTLRKEVN